MSVNYVSLNTDAVFSGLQLTTKQMPINPLGNKELERANIENSEDIRNTKGTLNISKQIAESQNVDVDKEPEGNVPWSEIMKQLQLHCTGNEEDDYNNIMEEIDFQISHAQTRYDLNYYQWLLEYTSRLFMTIEDSQNLYEEEKSKYYYDINDFTTVNMKML